MKMSKRIFIVLLTFAVLASSFALFASASEPVSGVDCDSLLAYFEEDVIFGYDFSKEADAADSLIFGREASVTQSYVADLDAPGGKYLSVKIAASGPKIKSVYFNWNSEAGTDAFYFDATLSADKSGANYPKYKLTVDSAVFSGDVGGGDAKGTDLLTLDFASGTVSYASGVDESGKAVSADAEYVLTPGAWYTVSFDYNAAKGTATAVISNVADTSDTVTLSDICLPYALVKNVRFGVHKNLAEGNELKIASISSATGNAHINLFDKQQGIEDAILSIYSAYVSSDISLDDKLAVCDAVNKILDYGFATDKADVNAAINEIKLGSINLYADALAGALESYVAIEDYYAKTEIVKSGLEYAAILQATDLSPVSPEGILAINNNIDAIYAAEAELAQVELDSIAFITLISEFEISEDYGLLLACYDAASTLNYNATYDGVAAVLGAYDAIVALMDEIKYEAESFIAAVDVLGNTERDFLERYYENKEFEIYENETYPGVTEALAKYNDVVLPEILEGEANNVNFINYIRSANFASYISAKEDNIKRADALADLCHPDFPGVEEAKALRLEVLADIELKKVNAKAYIDAVNALSTLSGSALEQGIKNACELQKNGNVLGIDGVTEANIKLDKIMSEIEQKTRYSEYFISIVDSLSYIYKAEDVYKTLVEAKRAEARADQTFPGVSEASVDLESYIEDYNDSVYYINDDFYTANLAAANTVGIGGETANTVADQVIAIIQIAIEEEEEDEE